MDNNYAQRSLLRRTSAILAITVVLALFQPATGAGADKVFTFEGGGFGHSVGMSQYGAYGMARDGYTWQEIITHYFSGTTVAVADPIFTDTPIWVGITQEKARVDFVVRSVGANPVPATVTLGGQNLTAAPGETITIEQIGNGTCRATTPSGQLTGTCSIDIEWDGWEKSPSSALELAGCSLPDWNAPGGTVFKPCTYSRGTMHIRPDNNTQAVNVTLEIGIEDYVLGISESPYGWGDYGGMAALEAQAVAARSYALRRALDRGDPADRPWCWCEIYDTPVDQNYVGWGHGTQNWIDAVRNTEHMVPTHPSSMYQGVPLPIEAFYSSSTFGWTEDSESGFTAPIPYLRNVDDHWALDPAVGNHSARWTRQFSGSSLAARLPGMSTVTDLEVASCSPSGAALAITFSGSGGPRTYTTRELRSYLGLRSMQIIRAGSPLPDGPACPQPGSSTTPPPVDGGPVVLTGMTLDDDSIGDSYGNADGLAQCGEVVEIFTTITNQGASLTGVMATLSSDDPYVSVRWNTTSTYPGLARSGSAANDDDWDLTIASGAPDGHEAILSMQVVADNGGPWDLDVAIPVSCRLVEPVASVGVGDIDGNGSPDIATSVRIPSGHPYLKSRDAATGETTGSVKLATRAWSVVALDKMPNSDTQVAALLVRNGRTRVVVADLSTGQRVSRVNYGAKGTPVALEAMPPFGDSKGARFAVLFATSEGRSLVLVRDTKGTIRSRVRFSMDPVDLQGLDDIGASGSGELAVLGVRKTGTVAVATFDPGDRSRFTRVSFGDLPAVGLETIRAGTGRIINTLAVLQQSDGEARVTLADPMRGAVLSTSTVPIAAALDMEVLRRLNGDQSDGIAVFGISPDGFPTAIVVNPHQSRTLSGPVFDSGISPVDLAVLTGYGPSGTTLAVLGSISRFEASIVLRDALSGIALGTIQVP